MSVRDAQRDGLAVENVSFQYSRAGAGVWDINLHVAPGERVALVGESGSGKTTVARLVLGILRPERGQVRLGGEVLTPRSRRAMREWRSRVQTVFQDPFSSLDPRMRIGRSVAEPLLALGLASGEEARARVREALESVEIDPARAEEFPGSFSGGQRQRIAIARALVASPELLVADEPVSALDMSTRASVMALLERLTRERGMSLLLVSHDLATVASTCDRLAVMHGGRIVEEGETARVLAAPSEDYTRELIAAVPRLPA